MPIYEFECPSCGCKRQVLVKLNEAPPGCEKCEQPMRKIVSPAAVHFKGSGFYVNDK